MSNPASKAIVQKLSYKLGCFIRDHRDSAWQQQMAGTYALATALILPVATLALGTVYFVSASPYAALTLPYLAVGSLVASIFYIRHRRGRTRYTGLHLIIFYELLALGLAWGSGIGVGAMVLCSGAVVLAGTLCGYWCGVGVASVSIALLGGFRAVELAGKVHPTYLLSTEPDNFGAVFLLALLLHLLAAVSGSLYHLEQTRRRLLAAEQSFVVQKGQLTSKMKRQNQKLQSAQFEKMQQIYRLAEVGELSTALMHDLANSLTTLALEIDGFESRRGKTSVRRAKTQMRQINSVLNRTRQHLKGEYKPQVFDVAKEVGQTIRRLRPAARQAGVTLEWVKAGQEQHFDCLGERVLLGQLLTNLVTNAIESYSQTPPNPKEKRSVQITLRATKRLLYLRVSDQGNGIDADATDKIFEPFYTTKQQGMGMGLYLTRRFVEANFKGRLELKRAAGPTVLEMILPRKSIKR